MKFLLVYEIKDFYDLGGGTYCDTFADKGSMVSFINEQAKIYGPKLNVKYSCEVSRYFEVKPVKTVTEYEVV